MAYESAKLFKELLESKGMHPSFADDKESVVRIGFKLKNTSMDLFFSFGESNQDVHIQGGNFLQVSEDNYGKVLQAVNACNQQYRWVKFILDMENGEVWAEDDAVIELDSCADETFLLMHRMINIVDEAYPVFMKAMWS